MIAIALANRLQIEMDMKQKKADAEDRKASVAAKKKEAAKKKADKDKRKLERAIAADEDVSEAGPSKRRYTENQR